MTDTQPPQTHRRLSISCRSPGPLAILRLDRASPDVLNLVSKVVGELPPGPGRPAGGRGFPVWLAPGEWLLAAEADELISRLAPVCRHTLHHIVDVTDGHAEFVLDGRNAAELLATGCSIDLHPRLFPPGTASRTLLHQIPVLITAIARESFSVLFDVSYQSYLSDRLREAAQGLDGAPDPE